MSLGWNLQLGNSKKDSFAVRGQTNMDGRNQSFPAEYCPKQTEILQH